jgi:N-acyl amino acid synthase of PEP-CTERM/exosortase system
LVLDHSPLLLQRSYGLRYETYCLDRHFLPAEEYPDALERDAFDRSSVHLGVVNTAGDLLGTVRLVEALDARLPLYDHCTIFPDQTLLHDPSRRVVEVSRLVVSRKCNRRAGDQFYALQGPTGRSDGLERRRGDGEIVFALYKALYQASKRRGFSHWVIAVEKPLLRLLARYGFPFRPVGPESDYYGLVSPYLMDLSEFDTVIGSGRIPALTAFLEGLEPEFWPVETICVA